MTNTDTATYKNVRIAQATRLTNSVNGNPRFELTLTTPAGGFVATHKTATDAACNYEVTNYLRKGQVHVWVNGRGTIDYFTSAK